MANAPTPTTDQEDRRRRRLDPRERAVSSRTAFLLLLTIVQAAFGYAFLGPAAANEDLRDAHVVLGLILVVLAWATWRATLHLTPSGGRVRMMRAACITYLALTPVQLLTGALLRWASPNEWVAGLVLVHLTAGLALPFLALAAHMGAVQPSLQLGADREHARALRALREGDGGQPGDRTANTADDARPSASSPPRMDER